MSLCDDLVRFADGELDAEAANAFRDHLRTCETCPAGLVEAIQLSAQLSTMARRPVRRIRWQKHAITYAGMAVCVVTAIGVWRLLHPGGQPSLDVAVASADVIAKQPDRPGDGRLAYAGAAAHRPPRDVKLGSGSPPAGDPISRDAIAALEKRGDKYGAAIAGLWNGEDPRKIDGRLAALEQTPAVRSDRAAIAVPTATRESAEPVLAELEALQGNQDVNVARAARWNYALLLAHLELPLGAASAFRAIAAEHEAGWAEEALRLAAAQEQLARTFTSQWARAMNAGTALVENGTAVPRTLVVAVPGVLRSYFYNAVRTAPSAVRVRALEPMAAQLDEIDDPKSHTLSGYVAHVAKLDFRRRAPYAAAYAALLGHKPVPEPLAAQLVTETSSDDVADIVLGAIVERDLIAAHRDWCERIAIRLGDPWFQIMLAPVKADVAIAKGDWFGAEKLLLDARAQCTPGVQYQCLALDHQLGRLYTDLHRIPEALRVLRPAVAAARAAGEPWRYQYLLSRLADTERFHAATATIRAYAGELLLMSGDDCDDKNEAYRRLTGAAILDVDGRAARRYLDETLALRCTKPELPLATYVADVALVDRRPDDLAQLRTMLEALRARGKLSAAERIMADAIEGRVAVEHDRSAGIRLLTSAIAAADAMPEDVTARKARAAAYRMLVFDAGNAGDNAGVLDLVAKELALPPPEACTVGMASEGKRAVVVVRGADGNDRGRYYPGRLPGDAALRVPDDLAHSLKGCARVRVMAPGAQQGQPRVLPPEFAWSYLVTVPGRSAAPDPTPGEQHALIVTNVTPPASLALPALSMQPPDTIDADTLAGPAATPSRVAAAMTAASEIQFHTHALLDVGVSDASHLVLSPEVRGGAYALTAEAIRKLRLERHPIVVLEACRAAVGARYEHAPWSLPDAFLAVGARAVFAAATEIPDLGSGQFFARVLKRVRSGIDPAVALRDERRAALDADPTSWVADVVLFE